MYTVLSITNFPQTGTNRSRGDAVREIASFYGGEDRADIRERAAKSWESAIREYNSWLWRFNRVTVDIDLSTPTPAGSATYDLPATFAEPNRAKLLDSSNEERAYVDWVPFTEFLVGYPDTSSPSPRPMFYTAENIHETGQIRVYPRATTASLTYPTMRLWYFRRIVIPTSEDTPLNVPQEVDEGIFQLGQAKMTHKQKSFAAAREEYVRASDFRIVELEHRFRDFPDIP